MRDNLLPCLVIYLAFLSLFAVLITVRDKRAAKTGRWRTKESTLFLISAMGGSVAMLVTMKVIRHKTKHAKFMVGIPVMIVLQLAAAGLAIWWKWKGGGA
ncbi:MAG: DUF1294 domain-containing protein [Oscillospiraceae bacterium]|nr:DUF1294 domain-containing protein [Oscillospiraceae bacterium]